MKIIHQATGEVLIEHVEVADTFYKRFKGLMGRKSLNEHSAMKIEPCSSIHCFFMKIPIDVVFLSKDHQVLKLIPAMKPWTVSPVVRGARYVLEANGQALNGKLKEGDFIQYTDGSQGA